MKFQRFLNIFGPLFGLLFVLALFWMSPARSYILTGPNFKVILTQTVIVAIAAMGMTMIIASGGIDLSVGSVVALSSVVGARLLVEGRPAAIHEDVAEIRVALAIVAIIGVGALIGAVNGLLIARLGMLPFIVTLGMMGIARGTAKSKYLANNQTVNAPPTGINELMAYQAPERFLPLPPGVWIAIALACLMALVLRQTVFGRYIFAIGSSEPTARLCGVRVAGMKIAIYALAGAFFGLAGLMQLSRLTQGDPTVAIGLELDVIASVVIGGASLNGGSGSVFGSMIGALIMAVLRNGLNQLGWPNYTQEIIIGVVIVLAVGIDQLRQRRTTE